MLDVQQRYRISEATGKEDHEWSDFISGRPNATVYHHPSWLKVLEHETKNKVLRLVCRDENQQLAGVFPLQYTKGMPFGLGGFFAKTRLSSLPRTPIGGPIALNSQIEDMLISQAIRIAEDKGLYIQIKSPDSNLSESSKQLSRIFWRDTYTVHIPTPPANIRFGRSSNHSVIKRAVQKALRSNISYRYSTSESDLLTWYPLYVETMRFHAVPARSIGFFKSIQKHLMTSGLATLMVAEATIDNRPRIIAGNLLFCYNKTVVFAFNGSRRDNLDLRANDLLHWMAIHEFQNRGYERYDLGEAAHDHKGLMFYKEKWGPVKHPLYHFYYPEPGMSCSDRIGERNCLTIGRRLWRCLPLGITSLIGKKIYENL